VSSLFEGEGGFFMSMDVLVLLPVLAGFGFLYWGSQVEDAFLKLLFQLLFLPSVLFSVLLGVIDVRLLYASDSELVVALSTFTYILGWIIFIVAAYIIYRLFMFLKDMFLQKKKDKEEELYG
jgi:hypothetical protein